jgi:hypothetical protein
MVFSLLLDLLLTAGRPLYGLCGGFPRGAGVPAPGPYVPSSVSCSTSGECPARTSGEALVGLPELSRCHPPSRLRSSLPGGATDGRRPWEAIVQEHDVLAVVE